jgi:hypothetical protein
VACRLSPAEQAALERLRKRAASGGSREEGEALRAREAVRYALEHHLYRNSTVERYQVVAAALEQGLTLSPKPSKQLWQASKG